MTSFIPFAILSGFFAALSSVFAKLFSDERTAVYHEMISKTGYLPLDLSSETSLMAMRVLCFVFVFVCNSVMWTLFTKALNRAPSSVQVSVVNGAINFGTSAVAGFLVFNEPLAFRWWIGASFILAGTILLSQSQEKLEKQEPKHKTQ
ncbi:hypothetical protein BDF14DRAFT_1794043 [Spinellus fusiger]|nr:hypothetical protein BDF14DRAFT_1794043 [Spinellus fusiger]